MRTLLNIFTQQKVRVTSRRADVLLRTVYWVAVDR